MSTATPSRPWPWSRAAIVAVVVGGAEFLINIAFNLTFPQGALNYPLIWTQLGFAMVLGITAIVAGVLGIRHTRERAKRGRGLAVVGLLLGILMTAQAGWALLSVPLFP